MDVRKASIDGTIRDAVTAAALSAGFDLVGFAAAEHEGSLPSERLRERFNYWIAQGREGEMGYLRRLNEEGIFMRESLHAAMPWGRSVIVCAWNYNAGQLRSIDPAPSGSGWIARYAWSGTPSEDGSLQAADYHTVMLERLRRVEEVLKARTEETIETRAYVDTGPIVERHFAEVSGIGWIGKNACLINQGEGSWLLLGVIVTSLPLAEEAILQPAADRCGNCTRCLDACPTGALIAPRQMDANLCISYLTIEKKGSVPEQLRGEMGRQVFGCDICQDVCPWNRKAPIATKEVMQPRLKLVNPSLDWLAEMDNAAFKHEFRGSPLERTGRKRLQRNVAIAMGNSRDPRYIETLERWAAGDDAILAEHAQWALERIRHPDNEGKKETAGLC